MPPHDLVVLPADPNDPLDHTCPTDHCHHANNAAIIAVKEVFGILGVDVDNPESVEEFREDLRFGKRMRKMVRSSTLALVGAFFAAVGTGIWELIASFFPKGH